MNLLIHENHEINQQAPAIRQLGNNLQFITLLKMLRTSALRRNTCLPHFVLLVFFVDQLFFLA